MLKMASAVVNLKRERRISSWDLNPLPLNSRERFLKACRCQPVDRPPVWLMRQAGRCLPEYRALKENYSFLELVQTPELAAEVTLQPIRRFHFDAAILFSDILVIPEALGQKYKFRDKGGVEMDFKLQTAADIQRLETGAIEERLQYAVKAIALAKKELKNETALLGFAGSPWTLANFMLEGGSAKEFTKAKSLFYTSPELFNQLMEKLTDAVATFLEMQIAAGVDAIQIFDSCGGVLSSNAFEAASAKWIRQIIARLGSRVPVIVFSKGTHGNWNTLAKTGAQILGLDWTVDLAAVHATLPKNIGVQGNLDPMILTTTPEVVVGETMRILREMRGCSGFIFNLGHGVPPNAPLENLNALATTIQNFK